MEDNQGTLERTIGDLEAELVDIGILDKTPPLTKEQVKRRVYEILTVEGDDGLGRRILAFAKIVDYDYEALKPFLNRDGSFNSELEGLGHLEFYLQTSQLLVLEKILRLLEDLTTDTTATLKKYPAMQRTKEEKEVLMDNKEEGLPVDDMIKGIFKK
jgi:hypothetical protein